MLGGNKLEQRRDTTIVNQAEPDLSTQVERSKYATINDYVELLPESVEPYTDKYFIRSHEVLEKEGLNPFIKGQVMIRKGPGIVRDMNKALAVFEKYANVTESGGSIKALPEGAVFNGGDTLIHFVAPVLDVIKLETMYLGILSAATTFENTGQGSIDLIGVTRHMRAVVDAAEGRPVMYFGARHWRYEDDAAISNAAFAGGASSCSTDKGGSRQYPPQLGVGTVPHILENVMAWKYGKDKAVVKAIKAFDKHIDKNVPRIALVDYDNREITRSIECAEALIAQGSKLNAVRVDTCGENVAEGAVDIPEVHRLRQWKAEYGAAWTPSETDPDAKYWYGHGVTITGVYALRKSLDLAGFSDVKIVLSSGFGEVNKVNAFVRAEKMLGVKLFDSLGVGGVYKSWSAKMDVVAVGDSAEDMTLIAKNGRGLKENQLLKRIV